MLDSLLDSDSKLDDSDSNPLSLLDSGHDSDDDAPQPVAPPSADSPTKHLQAYIKQPQLEKGKLEERNAALNATNGTLTAQQLKCCRHSPNQTSSAAALPAPSTVSLHSSVPPSSTASSHSSAPSTAASIITSETIIDKLILSLAKKYALTMEMFLPEKKSTEKAALVTELYASIDHELHPQMRTNSFFNLNSLQQAQSSFFNGLRTVSGSIFNMSPENWLLIMKIIFMLSPDQEFSGDGIGTISSIPYHTVFHTMKKFFIVKWTHEHIKAVVGQINGYVFDNVAQMEEDYMLRPCTKGRTNSKGLGFSSCAAPLTRVCALNFRMMSGGSPRKSGELPDECGKVLEELPEITMRFRPGMDMCNGYSGQVLSRSKQRKGCKDKVQSRIGPEDRGKVPEELPETRRNGGMVGRRNGGVEEQRFGGMEEWRSKGSEERRSGGVEEWRSGAPA
ncbi:hypothetical protein C8R48DRAFT_671735 [Suillus tomentosus]|nr:hypothetical protein C8R48DRAFT_671735 [Suillus tomentosus]